MTDLKDALSPLIGAWEGQSTLYLDPDQEGDTQPSSVEVVPAANGKALLVTYVWHVDDAPERGALLIERDPKQPGCRAAWVDSWHQDRVMMILEGQTADAVDMYGKYQAEGWPEWGWRIRLEADGDQFRLLMWNITPEGQENRAVVGEYARLREKGGS
jgi:hypothetical protein